MYQVAVEISFRASHRLSRGEIGLEPLHEHLWTVRAQLEGPELAADGLLVDFVKVKKLLGQIADKLEGKDLTEVAELADKNKDKNPSAEIVARYFYQRLEALLQAKARLTAVSIQEAPGCWASYRP